MKRNRGYTLIEMMTYIAIMAVIVNLSAVLLVSTMRLNRLGETTLDRLRGFDFVRTALLDTVQEAEGLAPSAAGRTCGADWLVVRLAESPDAPGAPRYAILGYYPESGVVGRMVVHGAADAWTLESFTPYRDAAAGMKFRYDTAEPDHARLVYAEIAPRKDKPPHIVAASVRTRGEDTAS